MTLQVLDAILQRSERDPDDPFIDTKFSTITARILLPGNKARLFLKAGKPCMRGFKAERWKP
jgi:hypothetical protein